MSSRFRSDIRDDNPLRNSIDFVGCDSFEQMAANEALRYRPNGGVSRLLDYVQFVRAEHLRNGSSAGMSIHRVTVEMSVCVRD